MQLELCAAAGGCRRIPAKKLQRWPGGWTPAEIAGAAGKL